MGAEGRVFFCLLTWTGLLCRRLPGVAFVTMLNSNMSIIIPRVSGSINTKIAVPAIADSTLIANRVILFSTLFTPVAAMLM